jgi:hypothetical protein
MFYMTPTSKRSGFPSFMRGFFGDGCPAIGGKGGGASLSADLAALGPIRCFAGFVLDLARGDSANEHGVLNGIGVAFLAFRAFWHWDFPSNVVLMLHYAASELERFKRFLTFAREDIDKCHSSPR